MIPLSVIPLIGAHFITRVACNYRYFFLITIFLRNLSLFRQFTFRIFFWTARGFTISTPPPPHPPITPYTLLELTGIERRWVELFFFCFEARSTHSTNEQITTKATYSREGSTNIDFGFLRLQNVFIVFWENNVVSMLWMHRCRMFSRL